MLRGPPSTRMLISQFLSYITEMNNKFDLFPGCVCYCLDENRTVLTEFGFLRTAVGISVEAFDAEMTSENPRCHHLVETADTLRGHIVRYLRDGGTLNDKYRRLVEVT